MCGRAAPIKQKEIMEYICPKCDKETEIEDLPERACDDMDWECPRCGYETKIGWNIKAVKSNWYATIGER